MASSEQSDPVVNQRHASPIMDAARGKELLQLARSTIACFLDSGTILDYSHDNPSTQPMAGIFATLWSPNTNQKGQSTPASFRLRGCIGNLKSDLPLYEQLQEVAIGAATRDPRFPPLTAAELETIRIEIALLSPLRKILELQEITIGQDGLLLDGLGKRGLLLPKVALRMGWDRESFLHGVCQKAGLPQNCWPGACNLYAFTTLVFDEAELCVSSMATGSANQPGG